MKNAKAQFQHKLYSGAKKRHVDCKINYINTRITYFANPSNTSGSSGEHWLNLRIRKYTKNTSLMHSVCLEEIMHKR